ncbi:MAG: shikimate dehydrogenase [Nitrospiraceae bacterium]|nr:shikimate dehydrogenase [Nitrospiraceae bacterium]
MNITGRTKITGLFGYPVEHTLSPAMHNAAFGHLGMDFCYLPFLVHPDSLGKAVDAVRALNLAGVNVTIPHKEAVIRFLDDVNEEASFIGAVNTVVNREGVLTGYNTDGRGFMRSLEENGIEVSGRKVLVVGAGGASRAIGYYLSYKAEMLAIHDIDKDRLSRLVSDLSQIRKNVSTVSNLERLERFDIIVNATPLGLKKGDPSPFDVSGLSSGQTVCDLIYKKTALLDAASGRGCRTIDGLGMLLWQGVLAFELWTSAFPPVDIMRDALLKGIR